jgi:hypothetical protein
MPADSPSAGIRREVDELTGGTIYEPVRRYLREAAGGARLGARASAAPPDELLDGLHDRAGVVKMDIMVGVHGVHVHAARRKSGQFIL